MGKLGRVPFGGVMLHLENKRTPLNRPKTQRIRLLGLFKGNIFRGPVVVFQRKDPPALRTGVGRVSKKASSDFVVVALPNQISAIRMLKDRRPVPSKKGMFIEAVSGKTDASACAIAGCFRSPTAESSLGSQLR